MKEKKLKESKEHEIAMRIRASNVGNIVGNAVPVSLTEVGYFYYLYILRYNVLSRYSRTTLYRTITLLSEHGIRKVLMDK